MPLGWRDDADLAQPPRQGGRAFDVPQQRLDIVGERLFFGRFVEVAPVDAGAVIERGLQIVAKGCSKRGLEAPRHHDVIND